MWMKSAVFLGILALAVGNVVKRDVDDVCYHCSNWLATGQGFVEMTASCIHYWECYKVLGTNAISGPVARECAVGTMVNNFTAFRGSPCVECDPAVCPPCLRDWVTHEPHPDCPYTQLSPPWLFSMPHAGGTTRIESCGLGGYFNDTDGICTCTEVGPGCTCRLDIPLETDLEDHSCHKAWVGQTGLPAMVTLSGNAPPGASGSGVFTGLNPAIGKGPHLSTFTLDGAFAGDWVDELSFHAWFYQEDDTQSGIQGVIGLGDCAIGNSMAIWIDNGVAMASLETLVGETPKNHILGGPAVNSDEWYFASVTFDGTTINFYVFDTAEYAACVGDPVGSCPVADSASPVLGTVSPRGCGFHIGSLGQKASQLFIGNIAQVKVKLGVVIF